MQSPQRFDIKDSLQKVLLISADKSILKEESNSRQRIISLATELKELHIIVLCDQKTNTEKKHVAKNVWIYPTFSSHIFMQPFDIWQIIRRQLVWKFNLWVNIIVSEQPSKTLLFCYFLSIYYKARLAVYLDSMDIYSLGSKKRLANFMYGSFIKRILSIRVPSENAANMLESLFPKTKQKSFVIPEFIYTNTAVSKNSVTSVPQNTSPLSIKDVYPQFNIIFLSVTDFYSDDEVKKLFEVFSKLLDRYPSAGLVLVGKQKHPAFDKEKRQFKTADSAVYDSRVDYLSFYYSSANIFVMVSENESNSTVVIDAATHGSIIVSSTLKGTEGIIIDQHSGRICSPASVENFFEAIVSTLETAGTVDLFRITLKEQMKDSFINNAEQYAIYYKYFLKKVYIENEEVRPSEK